MNPMHCVLQKDTSRDGAMCLPVLTTEMKSGWKEKLELQMRQLQMRQNAHAHESEE